MKTKKLLIGLLAGALVFGFTGTKALAADNTADTTVVMAATDETGTIKATDTEATDETLTTSDETADTDAALTAEDQAAAKAAAEKKAAAKKAAALKAAAIKRQESAEYKKQVKLLACLILTEAGNQSYKGKVGVANVVLNRVGSNITAEKIKDVIYAPYQFSVVRNGSFERAMDNYDSFDSAQEKECIKAAKAALDDVNYVGDSKYFTRYSNSLENQHPSGMRIEDHYFW